MIYDDLWWFMMIYDDLALSEIRVFQFAIRKK